MYRTIFKVVFNLRHNIENNGFTYIAIISEIFVSPKRGVIQYMIIIFEGINLIQELNEYIGKELKCSFRGYSIIMIFGT